MSTLRNVIRELLTEELAKLKHQHSSSLKQQPTVHQVKIKTNEDLNQFARQLLDMADDQKIKNDIRSGKRVFKLTDSNATTRSASSVSAGAKTTIPQRHVEVEKTLITEKDIQTLTGDQTILVISKHGRLTPLAKDELGRRGITLERTKS